MGKCILNACKFRLRFQFFCFLRFYIYVYVMYVLVYFGFSFVCFGFCLEVAYICTYVYTYMQVYMYICIDLYIFIWILWVFLCICLRISLWFNKGFILLCFSLRFWCFFLCVKLSMIWLVVLVPVLFLSVDVLFRMDISDEAFSLSHLIWLPFRYTYIIPLCLDDARLVHSFVCLFVCSIL